MQILLRRTYLERGTNGVIFIEGKNLPLCNSIELPWRNNERNRSCIPEGTYTLQKRFSAKHLWHLHLTDVPERSLILIHKGNNALKELRLYCTSNKGNWARHRYKLGACVCEVDAFSK